MMDATAQKVDYAVTENTEILLDLGPVDSVSYKISDRVDNIVLTSNHAQESLPKTIYACHVCDKIFHENIEMLEHLNQEHLNQEHLNHEHATNYVHECKSTPEPANSEVEHDYHRKAISMVTSSNQCPYEVDEDTDSMPYKCAHCGERFKRGSEVGVHLLKHSHTIQHCCDLCGMGFESLSELNKHCALYHSAQKENLMSQHKCGHCGVSFSHRNSLYKHIKSHRDMQPVASENKGSQGSNSGLVIPTDAQSSLKEKKTVKPSPKKLRKYSCNLCYSKFQSKESLTKHISSHSDWNPAICELCGEYFAIEIDLKAHQKIHHCKFLSCKICSRVFKSPKRLERHVNLHSAAGNKPTWMKTVKVAAPSYKKRQIRSNKKTKMQQNRNVSKRKTGTTEKKLTQISKGKKKSLTKFKSTTKSNVSVIQKTTQKNIMVRTKYKCDVCTKSFPVLNQLTVHMSKWHCSTQTTKYDCEYCDSSFCQRMTYCNHLLKHYRKRTYSCRYCCLDFQNARQLKEHMQSSKRYKQRYTCFFCLGSFNDKLSLKHHKETAHLNATIFKCNVCSRQFVSKKLLEGHMSLHRVKKQHQCSMCAQTFNRLSFLFQHLVKHGQRVNYRCQYCSKLLPTQMLLHKHLATHTIS